MNLADVMDEIGDRLDTIDGLRVYRYPPDNVQVPAAIVTYPEEYLFDETFGRGMDRITLPVFVMVGKASDRKSRDQLGAYVDGSGLKSIKAVIEQALGAGHLDLPGGVGNHAFAADAVSLRLTGTLSLRVDVAPDDWTPPSTLSLLGRWNGVGGQRSYLLDLSTAGAPIARMSPDGSTSHVFTASANLGTLAANTRRAIRADLVPNDGAGSRTVTFYTAPTRQGPWAQLGSPVTQAGAVSIHPGTAVLEVGANTAGTSQVFAGQMYGAEVRDAVGALVAAPDFDSQTAGATSFLDQVDRPWSVAGTAVIVAGTYTAFDAARVQMAEFDIVSMAGVEYVAATLSIDIAGQGAA